jgi:hypothetical protein
MLTSFRRSLKDLMWRSGWRANIGGFDMTDVSIAVLSAADFEIGRGMISELSDHLSYEDWLDWRYGMFMGRSLAGEKAGLVTIRLAPFLDWCGRRHMRPSESALDAFAAQLALHQKARSAA